MIECFIKYNGEIITSIIGAPKKPKFRAISPIARVDKP